MREVHRKELAEKAAKSTTTLGALVREALADKELQLHAALRTRLEKLDGHTFSVAKKKNSERVVASLHDKSGALIAWADSDSAENAIEYSLLGAMREGK